MGGLVQSHINPTNGIEIHYHVRIWNQGKDLLRVNHLAYLLNVFLHWTSVYHMIYAQKSCPRFHTSYHKSEKVLHTHTCAFHVAARCEKYLAIMGCPTSEERTKQKEAPMAEHWREEVRRSRMQLGTRYEKHEMHTLRNEYKLTIYSK